MVVISLFDIKTNWTWFVTYEKWKKIRYCNKF